MQKFRNLRLEAQVELVRERTFDIRFDNAFDDAQKSLRKGYIDGLMENAKKMALWTSYRLGRSADPKERIYPLADPEDLKVVLRSSMNRLKSKFDRNSRVAKRLDAIMQQGLKVPNKAEMDRIRQLLR